MRRSRFGADLARTLSWHRRKLAVIAAVAAVLTGVNAVAPPDLPSTRVVVTTGALEAGVRVSAAMLDVRSLPTSAVPGQAVTSPDAVVGRTLVAAVPAGAVLTDLSVVAPRDGQRAGGVLAPVRLGDAAVVALLRPGDLLDLVATDTQTGRSAVAVRQARVVTVPRADGDSALGAATSSGSDSQLVLVEVSEADALTLAGAATAGPLSAILH